jgi:mannose-6-phosphate isomerase-like protein (cupin superfamily)
VAGTVSRLAAEDYALINHGTVHAFCNMGRTPVRWIETQAPQFPAQHGLRNHLEWEQRMKSKSAE